MRRHDENDRGFASDNCAGAHPEVIAAVVEANGGHQRAYGKDAYTAHLAEVTRAQFGEQAEIFPVFNGTGANVTALTSLIPRWGAVIVAPGVSSIGGHHQAGVRPAAHHCARG